jgi:uncharacterized protein YhbP (UPF0306 family)
MMQAIDLKIIEFINEHHVLTLATCLDNRPYTANCFYVFNPDTAEFYFTSDEKTTHGQHLLNNQNVAANIVLETRTIGKIQGLQITGAAFKLEGKCEKAAKKLYLHAFPYAILKLETMWCIKVDFFKLTDNRLGFGKKLIWKIGNVNLKS